MKKDKTTKYKTHPVLGKAYNQGVADSLRIMFTHISSVEHGAGFVNSQKATDYLEMMKQVYSTVETLYNNNIKG